MKKIFFILSLIFAGAITLYSCNDNTEEKKTGVSCHNCSVKETYGHTFADFEDVVDRYTSKRWDVINNWIRSSIASGSLPPGAIADSVDSRSIWFSLDSLKQFICCIEKYSNLLNQKPDSLGIRMYYSVYPPDHHRFPNEHTIYMVPTFKQAGDNTSTGIDFDPRYLFNQQQNPSIQQNQANGLQSLSVMKFKVRDSTPLLILSGNSNTNDPQMKANDGSLCPPCSRGCIHSILDQ